MLLQLIHNPASGTHSETRLSRLQQAFTDRGVAIRTSETRLDGNISFAPDIDMICVAGGDGALRQVISEMLRQQVSRPICVFPAGTVNLVARELGYAADPEKFADETIAGFANGEAVWLRDPVMMSDAGPVIACLSAGPEGLAVAAHSPALKRRIGGLAYAVAALKLLGKWPRIKFTVEKDGENLVGEALYVCKGHYFAGNWNLAPAARLGRHDVHLVILRQANRRNYIRFLLTVALGRDPAKLHYVDVATARSLSIMVDRHNADSQLADDAFQIDGDPMPPPQSPIAITDQYISYCLPRAG